MPLDATLERGVLLPNRKVPVIDRRDPNGPLLALTSNAASTISRAISSSGGARMVRLIDAPLHRRPLGGALARDSYHTAPTPGIRTLSAGRGLSPWCECANVAHNTGHSDEAAMQSLSAGDLSINATPPTGGVLRLDWIGKSNDRQPTKALKPFFDDVAAVALEHHAAIEMHFEALEHFNSSTITALIQFIQALRIADTRLVIIFSGALKWQKLSFEALRIFEKSDGLLQFRVV